VKVSVVGPSTMPPPCQGMGAPVPRETDLSGVRTDGPRLSSFYVKRLWSECRRSDTETMVPRETRLSGVLSNGQADISFRVKRTSRLRVAIERVEGASTPLGADLDFRRKSAIRRGMLSKLLVSPRSSQWSFHVEQ
jgi:hypothetical protein